MSDSVVKAGSTYEGKKVAASASWETGDTIEGFVKLYGADVAFSYVKAMGDRNLSNALRTRLNAGKSTSEIKKELDSWKPGIVARQPRKSTKEALMARYAAADAEGRKAIKAEIKDLLAHLED